MNLRKRKTQAWNNKRVSATFGFAVAGVVILCLSVQPVRADDQNRDDATTVNISIASTYVLSYPLIARIRICNEGALSALGIGQDLSLRPAPGTGMVFQLKPIDGEGKPILLGMGADPLIYPSRRGNSIVLKTGECLTSTVDLLKIGSTSREGFASSTDLVSGVWELSVPDFMAEFVVASDTEEILIRDPNPAERSVARALGASKGGNPFEVRWVVQHPEVEIPDVSSLPVETRRVVELIGVLRSAVDSPEQGLFMIDEEAANGMDWGFLAPFIEELKYECLLMAGDEKQAAALKRELSPPDGVDLTLSRIEDGEGVVSGFLKARELEKRNREVRQPLTNP